MKVQSKVFYECGLRDKVVELPDKLIVQQKDGWQSESSCMRLKNLPNMKEMCKFTSLSVCLSEEHQHKSVLEYHPLNRLQKPAALHV